MTRPRPSEWAKLGTLLYWANRDGLLAACPEISDMGTRDPRRFDQFSDLNWSAVTLAYLALDALETC